ncbi:xanthine dehydrogenase accessory protein XdhC [Tepidimonas taiwanensis]|uniref:xanthine dehydrogenase accessory protein XdhC n=1 Tax=Tepidimonas taiwanensis TaxID=307486 RepID=UPI0021B1007C|nr:xanthine dehydrogenase accessory protein XdhC [Tepidimonas taiwanensis]
MNGAEHATWDDVERARALLTRGPGVLVRVHDVQGSAPRGVGAWMVVTADATAGSIGGGHLEWQAMAHARAMLARLDSRSKRVRWALGPSLGQCCGGVVHLSFERIGVADIEPLAQAALATLTPVAIFGMGHVGRALVDVLRPLPFAVTCIDARAEALPAPHPPVVLVEHADPVQDAVDDLPAGARVLVMTHRHDDDFAIVRAALERLRRRGDLPFIGLIGSRSKWNGFQRRLQALGFGPAECQRVVCPIGLAGIAGKAPSVIAVSVAAQLLMLGASPVCRGTTAAQGARKALSADRVPR